jgi:GntR family transcriptional regulator, transcriptional repressor for pyruvate dehydrogenase complex
MQALPEIETGSAPERVLGEVDRVVADLVAYMRKRGYEAGERIGSERDFATRFGVGRGVVREALSALESMRVVERRPNSGIYLRPIASEGSIDAMVLFNDLGIPATQSEVNQLVEMRRMLEIQSVAMAAMRWQQQDMHALDAILLATEGRLARRESIVEQDAAFHLQVVACTQNQFIHRIAHSYYLALRAGRHLYLEAHEQCAASHLGHVALRDALHARDPQRAVQAMEAHLVGMESYWLERVEDNSSQQAHGQVPKELHHQ